MSRQIEMYITPKQYEMVTSGMDKKMAYLFCTALVRQANPQAVHEEQQRLVDEVLANYKPASPEIQENFRFGKYHYELYEAAEAGDYHTFMEYAVKDVSLNDLSWCLDVVSDVRILKYIVEKLRPEEDMYNECAINAIQKNYPEIIDAVYKLNKWAVERMVARCKCDYEHCWPGLIKMYDQTNGRMSRCRNKKKLHRRMVYKRLRTMYDKFFPGQ